MLTVYRLIFIGVDHGDNNEIVDIYQVLNNVTEMQRLLKSWYICSELVSTEPRYKIFERDRVRPAAKEIKNKIKS